MRRSLTSRNSSALRFVVQQQQQAQPQYRNYFHPSLCATTRVVPKILQEKIFFSSSSSSSCPSSMAGSCVPLVAVASVVASQTPTRTLSPSPPPPHVGRRATTGAGAAHRNNDQQMKTRRGLRTDTAVAATAAASSSDSTDNDEKEEDIMFWYDRTDHVIGEALFGSINVLEATACLHYWLNKEEKKKQQRRRTCSSSSSCSSNSANMVDNNKTTTHLCSTALHYIFGLVERLHAVEWIMMTDEQQQQQGISSTRRSSRSSSSNHSTHRLLLSLQDLHQIVELWHDAEVRMHHHILQSNTMQQDQEERYLSNANGNANADTADSFSSYSAPPLELVSILPTARLLLEQVEDIAQRLIAMGAITLSTATAATEHLSMNNNNNNHENDTTYCINDGFHNKEIKQQQVSLSIELYNFLIDSAVRASQGEDILRHLLDGVPLKTRAISTTTTRSSSATTTTTTPSLLDDFRLEQENNQKQQQPVEFTLPRPNLQSFLLVIMGYRNAAPTDHTAADKAHRVLYDLLQQPDIYYKKNNNSSNKQQQQRQQQQQPNNNLNDNADDLPFRLVMDVWLKADRSDSVEKCRQVLEIMSDASIAVKASHFKPILEYCHEKEGLLHKQAHEVELAMQQHHHAGLCSSIEEETHAASNNEISNNNKKDE